MVLMFDRGLGTQRLWIVRCLVLDKSAMVVPLSSALQRLFSMTLGAAAGVAMLIYFVGASEACHVFSSHWNSIYRQMVSCLSVLAGCHQAADQLFNRLCNKGCYNMDLMPA